MYTTCFAIMYIDPLYPLIFYEKGKRGKGGDTNTRPRGTNHAGNSNGGGSKRNIPYKKR